MDLKSEKILIAGAGISGIGAAALLGKAGIAAAIYDGNEELDKEAVAAKLPEGMEISFELIREAGLRIPSPIGPTINTIC